MYSCTINAVSIRRCEEVQIIRLKLTLLSVKIPLALYWFSNLKFLHHRALQYYSVWYTSVIIFCKSAAGCLYLIVINSNYYYNLNTTISQKYTNKHAITFTTRTSRKQYYYCRIRSNITSRSSLRRRIEVENYMCDNSTLERDV